MRQFTAIVDLNGPPVRCNPFAQIPGVSGIDHIRPMQSFPPSLHPGYEIGRSAPRAFGQLPLAKHHRMSWHHAANLSNTTRTDWRKYGMLVRDDDDHMAAANQRVRRPEQHIDIELESSLEFARLQGRLNRAPTGDQHCAVRIVVQDVPSLNVVVGTLRDQIKAKRPLQRALPPLPPRFLQRHVKSCQGIPVTKLQCLGLGPDQNLLGLDILLSGQQLLPRRALLLKRFATHAWIIDR